MVFSDNTTIWCIVGTHENGVMGNTGDRNFVSLFKVKSNSVGILGLNGWVF